MAPYCPAHAKPYWPARVTQFGPLVQPYLPAHALVLLLKIRWWSANCNKSTASGAIYARTPILVKKIVGIPYSPVKWRDIFILAILYKSLHIMLGSGGSDQTGWKPWFLISSSPVIHSHRITFSRGGGGGGTERRGRKK